MIPILSVDAELAGEASTMPVKTSLEVLTHAKYVAVVGSRMYPEQGRIHELFRFLSPGVMLVSGGAEGVDKEVEREAARQPRTLCAVVRPSKAQPEDAAALLARNTVIVRGSDVVVAFWDGESRGTRDSIEKALTMHGFCIVALPGEAPQVWVPKVKR